MFLSIFTLHVAFNLTFKYFLFSISHRWNPSFYWRVIKACLSTKWTGILISLSLSQFKSHFDSSHLGCFGTYPVVNLVVCCWHHDDVIKWKHLGVTGPLCREFTGPGEFPTQRPVTLSFDVFFDLRLNKWLSKQPRGWWFGTPSWSLWRQCNDYHASVSTLFWCHCI